MEGNHFVNHLIQIFVFEYVQPSKDVIMNLIWKFALSSSPYSNFIGKYMMSCKTLTSFTLTLYALCREIWAQSKSAFGADKKIDIHSRLMKKYKAVPMWWFHIILVVNIALIIFICEYYNESLQLPWWGVLLACAISILFTLPIGIITATTNQVS